MQISITATSWAGLITGALAAVAEQVGGYESGEDFIGHFYNLFGDDDDLALEAYEAFYTLIDNAEAADRGVAMMKRVLNEGFVMTTTGNGLDQAGADEVPPTVTDEFGREAEAGVTWAAPVTEQDKAILAGADKNAVKFHGEPFFFDRNGRLLFRTEAVSPHVFDMSGFDLGDARSRPIG